MRKEEDCLFFVSDLTVGMPARFESAGRARIDPVESNPSIRPMRLQYKFCVIFSFSVCSWDIGMPCTCRHEKTRQSLSVKQNFCSAIGHTIVTTWNERPTFSLTNDCNEAKDCRSAVTHLGCDMLDDRRSHAPISYRLHQRSTSCFHPY